MHILVGLGNPGQEYEGTRHNIGFDVVDRISQKTRIRLRSGKGEYLLGTGSLEGYKIGLVKPVTFMNNSGEAVLNLRDRYELPLEKFLVICDDFQLPLGTLRLRSGGSDGGHNGLYSIIYQLRSNKFPRLRCGIASEFMPGEKSLLARFVLEPFESVEKPIAEAMVEQASLAALSFVEQGLQTSMNRFNRTTIAE